MRNRRPPKWVELLVYFSAHPKERWQELAALRRRYRAVAWISQRSAKRLAYREAFYWVVKAWPERLWHIMRLFWSFVFTPSGWS